MGDGDERIAQIEPGHAKFCFVAPRFGDGMVKHKVVFGHAIMWHEALLRGVEDMVL